MTINVDALAHACEALDVEFRGQTLSLTALTAEQMQLVVEALPDPPPPMGKDPNRGSKAPLVSRPDDPAYQARKARAAKLRSCAYIAVAADFTDGQDRSFDTVQGPERERWCRHMAEQLLAALSVAEFRRLDDAMVRLFRGESQEDPGNS